MKRFALVWLLMHVTSVASGQTRQVTLVARLQLDGRNVVAAALARDLVVVPTGLPGNLAVFDTTGRQLWARASSAHLLGGVAVSGDTVASLESGDGWELVLYDLRTGRRLSQTALDIAPGSDPILIGGNSGKWMVTVQARFTPPPLEALETPIRSVLAVSAGGAVDTVLVVADSGVQVVPPAAFGRSPIRAPFAPSTGSAADAAGTLFISTGRSIWRARNGADRSDSVELSDWGTMTPHERATQIDAWLRERTRNRPPSLKAETLLVRLAAMDTTTTRLVLGRIVASRTGALAVVRRDLAKLYANQDSIRVDIVGVGSRKADFTLKIGPYDTVLAFDSKWLITARTDPPPPGIQAPRPQVILWRLSPSITP